MANAKKSMLNIFSIDIREFFLAQYELSIEYAPCSFDEYLLSILVYLLSICINRSV